MITPRRRHQRFSRPATPEQYLADRRKKIAMVGMLGLLAMKLFLPEIEETAGYQRATRDLMDMFNGVIEGKAAAALPAPDRGVMRDGSGH